jgi:hypothetical protein
MPYPLILATDGDAYARLNYDRSWSVRWDRTFDVAYQPSSPRLLASHSYARLLLAARDNFFTTPWDVSTTWDDKWKHFEAVIDYTETDPQPDQWLSTITFNSQIIARINYDGSWSVLWTPVLEVARWTNDSHLATALIGICHILRAAKDRFHTAPWDLPDDDDQ